LTHSPFLGLVPSEHTAVENLPALRKTLSAIIDNYLNVQQDILETFIDRGQLRKLESSRNRPSYQRESAFPISSSITRGNSPLCTPWCASPTSRLAITFTTAEIHPAASARLRRRAQFARLAPLRSLKTPRQGPCRQGPQLSPLSIAAARILDLPGLPKAAERIYAPLTAGPSQPHQSRYPPSI
jgi:hypothetical protein